MGLLNHLFVRYPVPAFLYQACLKDSADPFKDKQEIYRQWFVTLAQGGSFPKLVKGCLTSETLPPLAIDGGGRIRTCEG